VPTSTSTAAIACSALEADRSKAASAKPTAKARYLRVAHAAYTSLLLAWCILAAAAVIDSPALAVATLALSAGYLDMENQCKQQ
jgi:hypothetical protein